MRSTLTLIRREFATYFWSPVAYVVLGVFLLGLGLLFHLTVEKLTAGGLPGLAAGIDPMPVAASYLGLALAGAMFLALGLWVSSLVRSQIVAALISLALSLVFILGGLLILGGFVPTPSDTGVWSYRL